LLDAKVIIVGVAGIFVALGLAAAGLLGFGHVVTAVGQTFDSGPVSQAGSGLSGLGGDVLITLILFGVVVVVAFLFYLFRQ